MPAPRQPTQIKPYANFIGGLWTESTPLNFPENTVQYTQNIKYNPDGSIERRLGLQEVDDILQTLPSNHVVESHEWKDAGNADDLTIQAVQVGSRLFLYEEKGNCRADYELLCSYNLENYRVNDTDIACYPVDFASGQGKLFVAHKGIQPLYITYNSDGPCKDEELGCKLQTVQLYERDFEGVDDGLATDEHPKEMSPEHLYNLYNQGWTDEYINLYFEQSTLDCEEEVTSTGTVRECEWVRVYEGANEYHDEYVCTNVPVSDPADPTADCVGCYPANNEVWQLGLYVDPEDGIEKWSIEELHNNTLGSSHAPRGHFIRNVFDTCDVFESQSPNRIAFSIPAKSPGTSDWIGRIRVTFTSPHGYQNGDSFEIVGSTVVVTRPDGTEDFYSYDGVYTIGVDGTATNDEMWVSLLVDDTITPFTNGVDTIQVTVPGDVVIDEANLVVPSCCSTDYRPETVALYASRAWYAGIDNARLGNRVYFSQVLTSDDNIGRMYQEADPTNPDFNELLSTDGGFIDIPELGWVKGMQTLKDALIIFADNGIWSITGGTYEYFTATSYSVSKLTEVGCVAKKSIEAAEDTWIFAARRGVYVVTSEHRVQNITEKAIHKRYRRIPRDKKPQIDIVYNPFDKTVHILHDLDSDGEKWRYCSELIINHRIEAWYEYRYISHKLAHAFVTGDSTSQELDIMYLVDVDDSLRSHFMSDCDFMDFGVEDAPAYLLTGAETLGELSSDREVRHISFFLSNEGETECDFRGIWDWACHECVNKWTEVKNAFKPDRVCDGAYPYRVIRTDYKKLKGYGRALELEFASKPLKPLKIYGWNIVYEARPKSRSDL